jgi:hypothetical protein
MVVFAATDKDFEVPINYAAANLDDGEVITHPCGKGKEAALCTISTERMSHSSAFYMSSHL